MTTFSVSRPDLAYALQAVLPHVGDAARGLDWVGLDGQFVFALDGHTVGIAGMNSVQLFESVAFWLSEKEAKDLYRFVKPSRVSHKTDTIQLLLHDNAGVKELHVGISPEDRSEEPVSEIYERREIDGQNWADVFGLVQQIRKRSHATECFVEQASLRARFAKAEREFGDRMRVYPSFGERFDSAVITVGSDFLGAIAGLSDEHTGPVGDSTLEEWGL